MPQKPCMSDDEDGIATMLVSFDEKIPPWQW